MPPIAWWLLLANVFWAVAYDTEYAMVDRNDDLKLGIKTSAITFGRFDVLAVMLCYAATLAILAWIGWRVHLGIAYFSGLAVAGLMLPENRALLQGFGQVILASGPKALRDMRAMGLYRQTRMGTAAVLAAALAGRLRKGT